MRFPLLQKRDLGYPAMSAGVTSKLWEMADMVEVLEEGETIYTRRGFNER